MLLPESVSTPAPALVKLVPAPLITPDMVKSDAFVIVGVDDVKAIGQDIDAVPEIATIPAAVPIVNVDVPAIIEAPAPIFVICEQLPEVFMVTVIPALIVISSLDVGVAAEPAAPPAVSAHIEPFQFPVATAYLAVA